jgi:hypothetical protein
MGVAKVVTMWLNLVRQRAEDRGGISIGVSQGGGSGIRAASSRTSARPHLSDATLRGGLIVGPAAVSDPRGASGPNQDSTTVLTCPVPVATVTAADFVGLWHFPTR